MNISAIALLLAVFTLNNSNAKSTFSNQIVTATTRANFTEKWLKFKEKFGKRYHSIREDAIRQNIFNLKLKQVEEHNAKYEKGQVSYKLTINQFSDYKENELQALTHGIITHLDYRRYKAELFPPPANYTAPDNFDWRKLQMIPPVKDQSLAEASWAFAAVGALEAHLRIHRNIPVSLSEQNLVDCVNLDCGCHGGNVYEAYHYILNNGGIATEESYPNERAKNECRYEPKMRGAGIEAFVELHGHNEEDLKLAVASQGPVTTSIAVSDNFIGYLKGIYDNPNCGKKTTHAVVVVGYGTENGKDYWIVRNSWGSHWGDQGYIKMTRNRNNQCGIGISGIFPKV